MWRGFWIFVGITFIAMVLCTVILSFARADTYIKNMSTWEEVITLELEKKIIFILKNPVESETVYAIIEVNEYCIPYYILVGRTLRKFFLNEPVYKEIEMTPKQKKKVWIFLKNSAGICKI